MPGADAGPTASRYFLDTNVLVHSFSGQDLTKRETARALANAAGACVSTQVLSELAHVLTRRFKVAAPEVRARVSSIAANCEVLVVSSSVVLDALRIMERYGYGFFDSQIIAAALTAGAPLLYSENLHAGQTIDALLTIRSPFQPRAEQRVRPHRFRIRHAAAGN